MPNNRDHKLKKNDTKIKKNFRRSRRAKRAGIPDAVLSSGARSAPELRPASGSRGLASEPQEIRKCQTLKMEPGDLRKCPQPLARWNNFLNQRQGCNVPEPCSRLGVVPVAYLGKLVAVANRQHSPSAALPIIISPRPDITFIFQGKGNTKLPAPYWYCLGARDKTRERS